MTWLIQGNAKTAYPNARAGLTRYPTSKEESYGWMLDPPCRIHVRSLMSNREKRYEKKHWSLSNGRGGSNIECYRELDKETEAEVQAIFAEEDKLHEKLNALLKERYEKLPPLTLKRLREIEDENGFKIWECKQVNEWEAD